MPANLAHAQIGRFQTRLSRLVDLVTSRTVEEKVPGKPGQVKTSIVWTGLLYKSDMKSLDSIYEWADDGAFRNQRGVSHPNDLSLLMRALTADELKAGLARLPESMRPATVLPDVPATVADSFRARAKQS